MDYKYSDGRSKVCCMRKAALWYIKGFPFAARVRGNIATAKSYEALSGIIDGMF
jgi:tRNA-dihydrouridine synthase